MARGKSSAAETLGVTLLVTAMLSGLFAACSSSSTSSSGELPDSGECLIEGESPPAGMDCTIGQKCTFILTTCASSFATCTCPSGAWQCGPTTGNTTCTTQGEGGATEGGASDAASESGHD